MNARVGHARPPRPVSAPRRARLPAWRRLSWRLGAGFLLLVALGIVVSGILQYRAQDRFLRQSLGRLLLNIARTGALLVDGDLHEAALGAGDGSAAAAAALRRTLRQIQEANQLADPVYTLVDARGEGGRFGVDSTGRVAPGAAYGLAPEIREPLRRVLTEGTPAFTGLYRNEHGAWISAFAPVKDAQGRTVAALDVDFRADVYVARLAQLRRQLLRHALAGSVLALLAGLLIARRIVRPLVQLTAQARTVVQGDLIPHATVGGRDELGLLGRVLHLTVERLHESHRNLVGVLAAALEAQAAEPGSLSRLARASLAVADRLSLTPAQREALELGAQLHDIGELGTTDTLRHKAGPLSLDERRLVERHPAAGAEILETVPLLTPALDVVSAHHERWDGGGYPQGLRAEEIPVTARVFAVVDALDAMTHARSHRPAVPVAEALDRLRAEAGKQFDPRVVEAVASISRQEWERLLLAHASPGGPGPIGDPAVGAGSTSQPESPHGPSPSE